MVSDESAFPGATNSLRSLLEIGNFAQKANNIISLVIFLVCLIFSAPSVFLWVKGCRRYVELRRKSPNARRVLSYLSLTVLFSVAWILLLGTSIFFQIKDGRWQFIAAIAICSANSIIGILTAALLLGQRRLWPSPDPDVSSTNKGDSSQLLTSKTKHDSTFQMKYKSKQSRVRFPQFSRAVHPNAMYPQNDASDIESNTPQESSTDHVNIQIAPIQDATRQPPPRPAHVPPTYTQADIPQIPIMKPAILSVDSPSSNSMASSYTKLLTSFKHDPPTIPTTTTKPSSQRLKKSNSLPRETTPRPKLVPQPALKVTRQPVPVKGKPPLQHQHHSVKLPNLAPPMPPHLHEAAEQQQQMAQPEDPMVPYVPITQVRYMTAAQRRSPSVSASVLTPQHVPFMPPYLQVTQSLPSQPMAELQSLIELASENGSQAGDIGGTRGGPLMRSIEIGWSGSLSGRVENVEERKPLRINTKSNVQCVQREMVVDANSAGQEASPSGDDKEIEDDESAGSLKEEGQIVQLSSDDELQSITPVSFTSKHGTGQVSPTKIVQTFVSSTLVSDSKNAANSGSSTESLGTEAATAAAVQKLGGGGGKLPAAPKVAASLAASSDSTPDLQNPPQVELTVAGNSSLNDSDTLSTCSSSLSHSQETAEKLINEQANKQGELDSLDEEQVAMGMRLQDDMEEKQRWHSRSQTVQSGESLASRPGRQPASLMLDSYDEFPQLKFPKNAKVNILHAANFADRSISDCNSDDVDDDDDDVGSMIQDPAVEAATLSSRGRASRGSTSKKTNSEDGAPPSISQQESVVSNTEQSSEASQQPQQQHSQKQNSKQTWQRTRLTPLLSISHQRSLGTRQYQEQEQQQKQSLLQTMPSQQPQVAGNHQQPSIIALPRHQSVPNLPSASASRPYQPPPPSRSKLLARALGSTTPQLRFHDDVGKGKLSSCKEVTMSDSQSQQLAAHPHVWETNGIYESGGEFSYPCVNAGGLFYGHHAPDYAVGVVEEDGIEASQWQQIHVSPLGHMQGDPLMADDEPVEEPIYADLRKLPKQQLAQLQQPLTDMPLLHQLSVQQQGMQQGKRVGLGAGHGSSSHAGRSQLECVWEQQCIEQPWPGDLNRGGSFPSAPLLGYTGRMGGMKYEEGSSQGPPSLSGDYACHLVGLESSGSIFGGGVESTHMSSVGTVQYTEGIESEVDSHVSNTSPLQTMPPSRTATPPLYTDLTKQTKKAIEKLQAPALQSQLLGSVGAGLDADNHGKACRSNSADLSLCGDLENAPSLVPSGGEKGATGAVKKLDLNAVFDLCMSKLGRADSARSESAAATTYRSIDYPLGRFGSSLARLGSLSNDRESASRPGSRLEFFCDEGEAEVVPFIDQQPLMKEKSESLDSPEGSVVSGSLSIDKAQRLGRGLQKSTINDDGGMDNGSVNGLGGPASDGEEGSLNLKVNSDTQSCVETPMLGTHGSMGNVSARGAFSPFVDTVGSEDASLSEAAHSHGHAFHRVHSARASEPRFTHQFVQPYFQMSHSAREFSEGYAGGSQFTMQQQQQQQQQQSQYHTPVHVPRWPGFPTMHGDWQHGEQFRVAGKSVERSQEGTYGEFNG